MEEVRQRFRGVFIDPETVIAVATSTEEEETNLLSGTDYWEVIKEEWELVFVFHRSLVQMGLKVFNFI